MQDERSCWYVCLFQESLQNAEPLSPTITLEPPLESSIPTPPDPSLESAEWCENCPICCLALRMKVVFDGCLWRK